MSTDRLRQRVDRLAERSGHALRPLGTVVFPVDELSVQEQQRLRTVLVAAKSKGMNLIARDEFINLGGRADDWQRWIVDSPETPADRS